MDKNIKNELLQKQLTLLDAATQVLRDSCARVNTIFKKTKHQLSIEEKESCEALTARFARLNDLLFQRLFRTLDQIELSDEGTGIDRLNRMEKRGIIESTASWKELREIRNQIAHEYLIEKSDRVLEQALLRASELFLTVEKFNAYIQEKQYLTRP